MSKQLKAGVIGAGVFGGYHAGKYAAHPDTEISAIFDVDSVQGRALADKFNCAAFTDFAAFIDVIDLASLTSPAVFHGEQAAQLLSAGKSVLVEKPLATNTADGEALIRLSADTGAVLAVGHQERLVFEAMGLFEIPERPKRITATRMGPQSERGTDVSVTLDLLVHDADLVLTLMDETKPKELRAEGRISYSDFFDEITAKMMFSQDTEVTLSASRMHEGRDRRMSLEYESGAVEIDFVNRSLTNTTQYELNENFLETPAGQDSLGENIRRFIEAIIDPEKSPAIAGEAGLRALNLALAIDAKAKSSD